MTTESTFRKDENGNLEETTTTEDVRVNSYPLSLLDRNVQIKEEEIAAENQRHTDELARLTAELEDAEAKLDKAVELGVVDDTPEEDVPSA